jgi:bacterioferritin
MAAGQEAREDCSKVGDYGTMKLFEDLPADEERHIDFLETQISLYEKLGAERYALLNAAPMDQAD